jgi:hypothetical protein
MDRRRRVAAVAASAARYTEQGTAQNIPVVVGPMQQPLANTHNPLVHPVPELHGPPQSSSWMHAQPPVSTFLTRRQLAV